jgi:hypothetical protein
MYTLKYNDKLLSHLFEDRINKMFRGSVYDCYQYSSLSTVTKVKAELETLHNVKIEVVEI